MTITDTPYDLRRRRLSVAGDVEEVIVSDKTAAVLRELVVLDPDCERLVFGMRAHPDGAILLASADDLEELIGFVAAQANHEPNRRRQHRLDAAYNALTESARIRPNPFRLNIRGPAVSARWAANASGADVPNRALLSLTATSASCGWA